MFCVIMLGMSMYLFAQPRATTFQPGDCGKDAAIASCIQCGYSTTNYGNAAEFNAMGWTHTGYDSDMRSPIQFDLLSIPPGSVVQSAVLSLYFDPLSSNGQHAALTGSNEAELVKLTSP